jgi:hypothetical protein
MLQQLLTRLPNDNTAHKADAAVLMALTREEVPRLILTKRAAHLKSHAGEVAFPGGKRDSTDASIIKRHYAKRKKKLIYSHIMCKLWVSWDCLPLALV